MGPDNPIVNYDELNTIFLIQTNQIDQKIILLLTKIDGIRYKNLCLRLNSVYAH